MKHCLDGWPERHAIEPALKPYWKVQGERTITPRPEPLMPTTLPDPWQSVAMDLFMLYGANYVLIVDYFSRYPEVIKLKSTSSKAVIEAVKAVLSRHGIPETVRSDNGPQIPQQTEVWITTDRSKRTPGVVVGKAEAPRSYIMETQSGKARRNRHQLIVMPSLDGKTLEPSRPELEQPLPESQLEQPQQEGE
ncbi:hypothetical protein EMCRGX_G014940 [Ephydatia muelleri]|eukprot:Em0005g1086a